jgi:hypothetical protein
MCQDDCRPLIPFCSEIRVSKFKGIHLLIFGLISIWHRVLWAVPLIRRSGVFLICAYAITFTNLTRPLKIQICYFSGNCAFGAKAEQQHFMFIEGFDGQNSSRKMHPTGNNVLGTLSYNVSNMCVCPFCGPNQSFPSFGLNI